MRSLVGRVPRFIGAAIGISVLLSGPVLAEGKLLGSVVDEEGNGIKDVTIKLIPEDDALPTLETGPRKKGKFVFGVIRPGNYRLVAFKEGLRVSWIDVNVGDPNDESLWAFEGDTPYGAELPDFTVTGLTTVTYNFRMRECLTGPGEYGTGEKLSPVTAIVKAIEAGRYDEADGEIARHLSEDPDSATFNYLGAFADLSRDRTDEALDSIDRTLASDPSFEGASLLKGKILEKKGDVEGAMACYEQETEIAESVEVKRDAYMALAVAADDAGQTERAEAALEAVVVIAPEQVEVYKDLANLYLKSGDSEKAEAAMAKVAELGGEQDPNALYNLGAKSFNEKQFEAAAKYFEAATKAAPDFADAHARLGFTRLNLGDIEGAAECLRRYLELEPEGNDAATARQLLSGIAPE